MQFLTAEVVLDSTSIAELQEAVDIVLDARGKTMKGSRAEILLIKSLKCFAHSSKLVASLVAENTLCLCCNGQ